MKIIYPIFLCFLLMVGTLSCTSNKAAPEEEHTEEEASNEVELTAEQFKTAQIAVGKVSLKALSGTIKVNGMLDLPPQSKVSISTPFGGMLKRTDMLQGKRVRKGEAVAVLEHPDYIQFQQDYLEEKTHLEFLKLEYERQQELAAENVNAKKTLQKAKSDYEITNARVLGLKAKLKLMNINVATLTSGNLKSSITLYSPIDGYVTEVHSNIGSVVSPSDVIAEIADTEHLHVELTVFEKDVPKLKIGQKVRFTLANETKERMATVYLIGRQIGADRTVHVHCHLDKDDGQLLPGMYLQALVESGSEKVPAVPSDAVLRYDGAHYIFAQVSGSEKEKDKTHFKLLQVNPGVTELGYTEINFVDKTDWESLNVVLHGSYDLLSAMKNTESGHGH